MRLLIAIFIFFFTMPLAFSKQHKNKSSVYKYTRRTPQEGCKTPKFEDAEKTITLKYKNVSGLEMENYDPEKNITIEKCIFSMKDMILFEKSRLETKIGLTECYKNKEKRLCCKVINGEWEVFDGVENVVVNTPDELQIGHILPYSYISRNMKNCNRTLLYYNYMPNLTIEFSDGSKKNNDVCGNKETCDKQRQICKQMSHRLMDKMLCDRLEKLALSKQFNVKKD